MRIDILSVVPELLPGFLNHSILKRAQDKGIVEIVVHDLHDYSTNKHRKVDDYPYSGISGMVMTIQPIENAIKTLKQERRYDAVIFPTPDAPLYKQKTANYLATLQNIIILCGHYKGVDQRVREHLVTMEVSIGDYVLTGGELAAAVIADSVVRLLPGVLSDETSALTDSFQDNLLSHPVYTRPANYNGWEVPPILLSGDDKKIAEWHYEQSMKKTKQIRPDLLEGEE